ncbi:T9SS type A sorting domain-containing protein [Fulvivirga sp. RKSG066]|uniref:G8 domain-containing protein n=1 Tax=Fulvivirga aurantia TaxID=2529383 RepID=UPI0012BC5BC1|nr:G8 domain-containing protein [Fulvivirga aurantia]MTI21964.1 T9SS type A sorting domain-containing protein [Fulvivirga aurantia]
MKKLILTCLILLISGEVFCQIATARRNPSNPVWSHPESWDIGMAPSMYHKVVVPVDVEIKIDRDVKVKDITIHGRVEVDMTKDIGISTEYILVDGPDARFEWGTELNPYTKKGVIGLTGNNSTIDVSGLGTKFIGAINRGEIDIHGENRVSWTKLSRTADAGTEELFFVSSTDWRVGDEIVVASTDYSAHQAEKRTITAVSGGGTRVSIDTPIDTMHYGELQHYKGGSLTLDERAEVGLLTRNILIMGENPGTDGFGGHIIIRGMGSKGRISGVELFQMGQKSRLGRYPVHWHHGMNAAGQYIKNSSIHKSFNRAVTVHHTDNALIEEVVAYDHIGHGFFLEAGSERGNVFNYNLGILTRKPKLGEEVQLHDRVEDPLDFATLLPATYWITNPDNTFIGNVAAGSEGSGFWFTAQPSVIDNPTSALVPKNLKITSFQGNTAHSNNFSNLAIDGMARWNDLNGDGLVSLREESFEYSVYTPNTSATDPQIIPGFTSYKSSARGIWTRATTIYFDQCRLADSHKNTFFSFNQILTNSLTVGQSDNVGIRRINQTDTSVPYSLPVLSIDHADQRNRLHGHTLYDGPSGIKNVHFAGLDNGNAVGISIFGAHRKSPVHWSQGITWEAGTPHEAKVDMDFSSHLDSNLNTGLVDFDGSVTGIANSRLTPKIQWHPWSTVDPMGVLDIAYNAQLEVSDVQIPDWDAINTFNLNVGTIHLEPNWGPEPVSEFYAIRYRGLPQEYDRPSHPTFLYDPGRGNSIIQPSVYTHSGSYNRNQMYIWQFHKLPYSAKIYLQWAEFGGQMISAIPNVPSDIELHYEDGTAVTVASDIYDLTTASSIEKYFIWDNTLYISHYANQYFDDVDINGLPNHYRSKPMIMCQPGRCGAGGASADMFLADYENDDYDRSSLDGVGITTPSVYVSADDPGYCPAGDCDDYIMFYMKTDGDGVDEYLRYTMNFYDQPWTHFNQIRFKVLAPAVQLILKDRSEGDVDLGVRVPASDYNLSFDLSTLSKDKRDEIYGIELRIYESYLGPLSSRFTVGLGLSEVVLSQAVTSHGTARTMGLSAKEDSKSIDKNMNLYPNPTNGSFTISSKLGSEQLVNVKIYDTMGKEMYSFSEKANDSWSHTFNKEGHNLPNGLYKVVLITDNESSVKMLLIRD